MAPATHGMKVTLTVNITLEQATALRKAAEDRGVTVQVFLRRAIENLVADQQKTQASSTSA